MVLAGCAARSPGALEVLAEAPGAGAMVQQTVDVRHTERGWITVDFAGPTATGHLPRGRYDAVRITSLTSVSPFAEPVAKRTTGSSEVAWVSSEVLVEKDFCVGSKDPGLALRVDRNARTARETTRLTMNAPCDAPAPRSRGEAAVARAARRGRP
jgi:hypothetical protein